MPFLSGLECGDFIAPRLPRFRSHAHPERLVEKKGLIAALKALRHPKSSFQQAAGGPGAT